MTRIEKLLFSTKTMTVLLILYAVSMAVATFVENDFDTPTAKALIYDAKWFELLMLWLIGVFVANIKIYGLTKREKWPILAFHLAFIIMFIGGAITRYISFEGQMPIEEGETVDEIVSDKTYFKLYITDGNKSLIYDDNPYQMSYFNAQDTRWPLKRTYKRKFGFDDKIVTIKTLDYIPMAKDSVRHSADGKKMLKIVSMGGEGRVTNYIFEGSTKNINGTTFSFNSPVENAVQLIETGDKIFVTMPNDAQYMSMAGQQIGMVSDTALLEELSGTISKGEITTIDFRTLYSINQLSFLIPGSSEKGDIVYYPGSKANPMDKNLLNLIQMEVSSGNEKDTVYVKGGKGVSGYSVRLATNDLLVSIGFGSNLIELPFALRCDKFTMTRYPGSSNPSSYESNITVIDGGKEEAHHIYMNNVMDYRGYRFFQASYFPDESGTILSVNKDWWGTNITYLGYFLLFGGMFLTLFWKGTHFWKLNNKLKELHKKTLVLLPIMFLSTFLIAQHDETAHGDMNFNPSGFFAKPGELENSNVLPEHADKFAHLLVQDFRGRIKPMNTMTLDLIHKLYKKDKYKDFNSDQWFISMQIDPSFWVEQPIILVGKKGGDELAKEIGANAEGYTTFNNLFDINTGEFILEKQYNSAFSKKAADQSNYDKEVISVTERFNIFNNIVYGYYTKVVPVRNDPNHTWRGWMYTDKNNSVTMDTGAFILLGSYFNAVKTGMKTNEWENANSALDLISKYQHEYGKEIIPADSKVSLEVFYNKANLFFWLMITYSLLGIVMVFLGFAEVLSTGTVANKIVGFLTKICLGIIVIALSVQSVALGIRWYLSGHAPWSSGYEAIVFISAIGVLSGLILYKNRNAFIPAAGALVAMIMMGFAHGGSMLDPQITPLEPVLKSYWLMVHVGIITSSYGFFGLSAVISIITLIMFNMKSTSKIQQSIQELTIVNEMASEIGVFALTVGTFLGGMWANESWGRYWSWDPKETWAFISVIFYAVVLHLRLVPGLRGRRIFNTASMWAIWSVIFTYFGVNYYLSGLHSYAAGDPMPIPVWIPVTICFMALLSILAYFGEKKQLKLSK